MYSLADSAKGFFSIEASSGIIVLEQPLDREQQPSHNISVQATDQSPGQALSSFATVTITVLDINDNPPVFERRDYLVTVPEDTSPGTLVLAVFATSKDIGTNAEITYLIRSGNEQGKFRINPKSGGSKATQNSRLPSALLVLLTPEPLFLVGSFPSRALPGSRRPLLRVAPAGRPLGHSVPEEPPAECESLPRGPQVGSRISIGRLGGVM